MDKSKEEYDEYGNPKHKGLNGCLWNVFIVVAGFGPPALIGWWVGPMSEFGAAVLVIGYFGLLYYLSHRK